MLKPDNPCMMFLSRFALNFIEKGGVPGLISILAMYRAPPFALRLAIAALASLVASCGAAGAEAVLEWNNLEAAAADEDMSEAAAQVDEEDAEQPDAATADDQVTCIPGMPCWVPLVCLLQASWVCTSATCKLHLV